MTEKPAAGGDVAEIAAAFTVGMKELGQTFSQALAQATADTNARFAKLESEHAALKGTVEKTPEHNHTARPVHAGGDGVEQTDC
ncbi:hypothetical protein D3C77_411000 [compost metagenome]